MEGGPSHPDSNGGWPLDQNGIDDIEDGTLKRMVEDCAAFRDQNASTLMGVIGEGDTGYYTLARAGHDFWLTRNGRGAGFWDRGLGAAGDKLTEACKKFGEFNLYVGDDGKVYGS